MESRGNEAKEEAWPRPPSFDKNAPVQYPKKIDANFLMKQFRGEKISDMPAPFTDSLLNKDMSLTDAQKKNQINLLSKNLEKSQKKLSNQNPFRLDTNTDPFNPQTPSFFSNINNNNNQTNNINDLKSKLESMPLPCRVTKPEKSMYYNYL